MYSGKAFFSLLQLLQYLSCQSMDSGKYSNSSMYVVKNISFVMIYVASIMALFSNRKGLVKVILGLVSQVVINQLVQIFLHIKKSILLDTSNG